MGDHASRGSTPVGAFLSRGSLCVIYFVPRKRFRQYRGCMLGHFVPKKRFSLHQMCVLHCSLYIIPYVSPRPRPVCTKTFFTHVMVKIVGLCSGENVLGGTECVNWHLGKASVEHNYSSISIRVKELGDIERVSLPSVTSRGVSV